MLASKCWATVGCGVELSVGLWSGLELDLLVTTAVVPMASLLSCLVVVSVSAIPVPGAGI